MMKLKYFILSMAFMLAVALTGCSASRENNSTAPEQPTGGVSSDHNDRASARVDGNVQNSPSFSGAQSGSGINHGNGAQSSANVDNDAFQGGGAGGTNDQNNDGNLEGGIDNVVDDIGDAAGDLARGAGDVARGAGNAIGDTANDIGGAMR